MDTLYKYTKKNRKRFFYLKPILVFPFPFTTQNLVFWWYRIFWNGAIFVGLGAFAYFTDSSRFDELIFDYNFGGFMFGITVLFSFIIPLFMMCGRIVVSSPDNNLELSVFKNETTEDARSFESLFKNGAYLEIAECLEYGILSPGEIWVYLFFFCFRFCFFVCCFLE